MRALSQPLIAPYIKKYRQSQKGQTLVEYALILCILTIIALGIFTVLGNRVKLIFSGIDLILDTAQSS